MLLDKPFDHRKSGMSNHARLLEVFNMRVPSADHKLAAWVAPTREAIVEFLYDDGELGVEARREGVCVGVAAATHEGDFESDFVGEVIVDSPIDV